ncbi:MAG: RNA polymerase sigma factor RpoH [Proteobacteria bacterium]|nr:RNA polymerase sigma factor RpoH [Pseudomonadota bacterium]
MGEQAVPALHGSLSPDQGSLIAYLRDIKKFPMLEPHDEYILAKRWIDENDREAAHRLVTSHLRLVAKVAAGYKGYGLPLGDLIAEGNIGLMHAVKKFDPDKGFRLSTYALWWIKAMIQEYILKSWSLVKIGTTAAQKRLFFNLKRLKNEIQSHEGECGDLTDDQVKKMASELNISSKDITEMEQRIKSGDLSLNNPVTQNSEEGSGEWQDWLADEAPSVEDLLIHEDEFEKRKSLLAEALTHLSEREAYIMQARRLDDPPQTLETISEHLKISKERVRQIEANAFLKLQKYMREKN